MFTLLFGAVIFRLVSHKRKNIYILFISELNVSKIGTSSNVQNRVKQLQTGCPYKIDFVRSYDSPFSTKIEKILHRKYQNRKVDNEEYKLTGEWFNLDIKDILGFESECTEIEKTIDFLKKKGNPFLK